MKLLCVPSHVLTPQCEPRNTFNSCVETARACVCARVCHVGAFTPSEPRRLPLQPLTLSCRCSFNNSKQTELLSLFFTLKDVSIIKVCDRFSLL